MTITIEGVQARFEADIDDKHGVLLYRGYTTPIRNIGEGFCCWVGLEMNTGTFLVGGMLEEIAKKYKSTIDDYEGKGLNSNEAEKNPPMNEEVKIEIVGGNISKRTLTYKGNIAEIHAVYPSLTVPPICWAGRLDGGLSNIPHQIAFAGVTIEEAAREFKKWVDACELGRKAITEQAPPKKKISLVDVIIEHEIAKGTPESLGYAACLALAKSTWSGDGQ